MAKVVSFKEITEALQMQSETTEQLLDRETGEILLITDEDGMYLDSEDPDDLADMPDWQREHITKLRAVLDTDRVVRLPGSFDIHEWAIMERFCRSLEDTHAQGELSEAIHGNGAFRLFKSTLDRLGLRKKWYAFRDAEFEQIAREWLEENKIPYM